jgi:hypothetical protein
MPNQTYAKYYDVSKIFWQTGGFYPVNKDDLIKFFSGFIKNQRKANCKVKLLNYIKKIFLSDIRFTILNPT